MITALWQSGTSKRASSSLTICCGPSASTLWHCARSRGDFPIIDVR
jgi:hypothetical protein